MSDKVADIWITRYALSNGRIRPTKARISADGYAVEVGLDGQVKAYSDGCFMGSSGYALSKDEAVKQAETMRLKKIASLQKQIAKLEKTRFVNV